MKKAQSHPQTSDAESRRDFLKTFGRRLSLGMLGIGGGVMAVKSRKQPISHQCVNQGICPGCGEFADCKLPQALSAKRVQGMDTQQEA